ncbi:methyl-accepting chemotaxis protein [Paraglaciecola polaris]|uniref:methyl-accepting chemotaxis protein n=1 Tax=Paraglaciecola polaris TaxID=222814 RepID=UPI0030ECDD90
MIRKIRIGARSLLAFGLLGLISLGLGCFGIYQMNWLNEDISVITSHRIPALLTISHMQRDFLLTRLETANLGYAHDPSQKKPILQRLSNVQASFMASKKKMHALATAEEAKKLLIRMDNSVDRYVVLHKKLIAMYEQGYFKQANAYREQGFLELSGDITQVLYELNAFQKSRADDSSIKAKETFGSNRMWMVVVIIIALIMTVILTILFSRSVILPLNQAVEVAQNIAKGDLSQIFNDNSNDEAADMIRALSDMQENLKQTIQAIADSSSQLASTSEELSVVTRQSSMNITQQGSELEQAVTAVNEMTVAIEEVARNSNFTYNESESANTAAIAGRKNVQQTIDTIHELVNELQSTKSGVDTLAFRVKGIGSVLDVIRAIADQTNLLSLNAAIEAARAGESGRGFAVVADEVRALAHRTQESTKEIENMIALTQGDTEKAVSATALSNERANQTLTVANEAGASLQHISNIISQINEQNLAIASAIEQQATVAKEVDQNLVNIRDLADQTAVGASQSNIATVELATLADSLNNLILKFKLS